MSQLCGRHPMLEPVVHSTFITGSFLPPRAKWSKPFNSKAPSAPRGSPSRSTYHRRLAGSQPLPTETSRYLRHRNPFAVSSQIGHSIKELRSAAQAPGMSQQSTVNIRFSIVHICLQCKRVGSPAARPAASASTPTVLTSCGLARETARRWPDVSPAVVGDLGAQHPLRVRLRRGQHHHVLRLATDTPNPA